MSGGVSLEEGILLTDEYLYRKDYVYYSRLDRTIACLISRGFVRVKYDAVRYKNYKDFLLVRGFRKAIDNLIKLGYIKLMDHLKLPNNPTVIVPNYYNSNFNDVHLQGSKKLGERLQEFYELIDYLYISGIIDREKTAIMYLLNRGNITSQERDILKSRSTKKSKGWGRRKVGKRIVPSKKGLESVDIFICSASFEERCTRVSHEIENKVLPEYSFIFVDYETYNRKVEDNLSKLEKRLEKISKKVETIHCDFNNLEKAVSAFKLYCSECELQLENKVIFIDISTFTKSLFLNLLPAVDNGRNYVVTYYTEVGDYGDRQSYGDYKIRPLNQFKGYFSKDKKDLSVIFAGFEKDRTTSAIEQIDPESTILLVGKDARKDWLARALKTNKSMEYKDIKLQYASSLNDEKVYEQLINIHEKYGHDYNITLVPIGSKIQALGAYKFQKDCRDVRISIVPPEDHSKYDPNYSIGTGEIHTIPMNNICKIRKKEIIEGYL